MNQTASPAKPLRGIIQVVISVILLGVALRQVAWADLRAALSLIKLAWLLAAGVLFLVGFVVRALRWQALLDALGLQRPLSELTRWYLVGGFFNVLLPTGFGGDVVRVVGLKQDTQRGGAALNSVVVDRYLGLIALLGMGLVAGLLRPDLVTPVITGLIAVLFCGGLLAAWLLTRRGWAIWARREDWVGRLLRRSRVADVAAGLHGYTLAAVSRSALISVGFNLLLISWHISVGFGLGLRLPVAFYFIVVPLISVALLLPAFGGLGVRELSYVALLGRAGVPEVTALAFSFSIYLITVAAGLLGGLLYLAQGLRSAHRKM